MNDVNVELQILLCKLIVKSQETTEQSESRMLLLVFQDRSYELIELLVSYIFKSVAILEILVGPFNQVYVCC